MLKGMSKDPSVKNSHLWTTIMTMNRLKQQLFMGRVLMLHEIATKQGGRATVPRLSLNDWIALADMCCVLGHILECMDRKLDGFGNRMFKEDLLQSIVKRAIEGTLVKHLVLKLTRLFLLQESSD